MTPIKIGIIEDDLIVGKTIYVMLQQIGYTPVKAVRNYEDAMTMLRTEKPDLILIDIVLEGDRDGIQVAEKVNQEFGIPFIFLTANSDTATVSRAKEVKPFAYLVKPFYENDLYSSIEIAFNNYNQLKKSSGSDKQTRRKLDDSFFIKEAGVFHKVQLSDILYIECDHIYLKINTSKRQYLIRSNLDDFLKDYLSEEFIRIHRSYTINTTYLESISNTSVKVSEIEIPLHKNYREELMKSINQLK